MSDIANLFIGTRVLTVDAVDVGWLKGDILYTPSPIINERKKGIPLYTVNRNISEVSAKLTASIVEFSSGNLGKFVLSGAVSGASLTVYVVVVTITNTKTGKVLTISFPQANIIPTGTINLGETTYIIDGIEIVLVGNVMPSVTVV